MGSPVVNALLHKCLSEPYQSWYNSIPIVGLRGIRANQFNNTFPLVIVLGFSAKIKNRFATISLHFRILFAHKKMKTFSFSAKFYLNLFRKKMQKLREKILRKFWDKINAKISQKLNKIARKIKFSSSNIYKVKEEELFI